MKCAVQVLGFSFSNFIWYNLWAFLNRWSFWKTSTIFECELIGSRMENSKLIRLKICKSSIKWATIRIIIYLFIYFHGRKKLCYFSFKVRYDWFDEYSHWLNHRELVHFDNIYTIKYDHLMLAYTVANVFLSFLYIKCNYLKRLFTVQKCVFLGTYLRFRLK